MLYKALDSASLVQRGIKCHVIRYTKY